ncbi:MAG: hypothetical protein A2729_03490 [Candidatus Buchananbacteria bacterium RIFCSPHIGHO2_01_FULL_39_14]|uniref:Uncharacterized protein n=1 Tax=Candidatus Buchananbacteria bacterium RIFCSPHIGHO2_01_FULL_39_14 TaxID=1797532 RepID=A0A1G1XSZ0_9BACT|nr:MAG: hypothetical protein A2729_03490 [Candidatus Buchananbacteria bacterium RIFCSPHIGHO2_01_FULL_39_14]
MKKSIKLLLAIVITITLYIGFYFLLVVNAQPENYLQMISQFIVSLVAGILAIPIGIGVRWFLQKKNIDKQKSTVTTVVIAAIYGYLLGWLSLTGMIIGEYIIEKEE